VTNLPLPFVIAAAAAPAWVEVPKAHPMLVALADRHYTRQQPGTAQFTRPGVNLCLLLDDGSAGWVTWRPIPTVGRMDGLWCWECTFFRNEGRMLSSDLVRSATDYTHRVWGWPPRDGLITAVGVDQTAARRGRANPPGWCFIQAGWTPTHERDGKAWLRAPDPVRT